MIQYTVKVYDDRTEWFNEKGQKHREDGPAIEYTTGTKSWYKEGQLHREDGPAVEYTNGDKEWHKEGQLHRLDGPAIELANGYKQWILNGKKVTESEVMNPVKELTMAQLEELLGHKVKVIK